MAVSWWQPEVPVLQQQAAIVLLGLWDIPGDRSTAGKAAAQSNTEAWKMLELHPLQIKGQLPAT